MSYKDYVEHIAIQKCLGPHRLQKKYINHWSQFSSFKKNFLVEILMFAHNWNKHHLGLIENYIAYSNFSYVHPTISLPQVIAANFQFNNGKLYHIKLSLGSTFCLICFHLNFPKPVQPFVKHLIDHSWSRSNDLLGSQNSTICNTKLQMLLK